MPVRLAYKAYQFSWVVLDWIYPPQCGGCGKGGSRWCPACASRTKRILGPVCPKCGQMQESDVLCTHCRLDPPHYYLLRSWAVFGGTLREAIHQLKYKRNVALGEVLARPLVQFIQDQHWMVDIVQPVPLSLARLAERGYNQASLLARPIALGLGVKFKPQGLRRIKHTLSQVGLTVRERQKNVENAFRADHEYVHGKNVLVVDDVTTTGSTMDACACALLEAGAARVYGLTLARAVFDGQA